MRKPAATLFIMVLSLFCALRSSGAEDLGLFRTITPTTPERGIVRMSNTSFLSDFAANRVLIEKYGVKNPGIFSSVTEFDFGITNHLAVSGSLPYYIDMFKQGARSGKKTGAGDVVVGFHLSRRFENSTFRGFALGTRFRIPEQLGYGPEPLGLRTFSYGEIAYSIEASAGFRFKVVDWNLSAALIQFPKAADTDSVLTTDLFYDTGFGYMGIGNPDASGLARGIFPDQVHVSFGSNIPFTTWLAGILEVNSTFFTEKAGRVPGGAQKVSSSTAGKIAAAGGGNTVQRENIVSLGAGIRIGKKESVNISIGMDFALKGPVPDRTFLFKVQVPILSPRGITGLLKRKIIGDEVRARSSRVAISDFTRNDLTFLYERELKQTLLRELFSTGLIDVVPNERIERVFQQKSLVPLPETPENLGVRLGASYLIDADIVRYKIDRSPSFSVPYLISLAQTTFSLDARASVRNLVTGETHHLGVISSNVIKPRGVNFFPVSASSDLTYLSEPERRRTEKELIDSWVKEFNRVIFKEIKLFGWEPKRSELKGEVETEG